MTYKNHYPNPPLEAPDWMKELVRALEDNDNVLDSQLANRTSFSASTSAAQVVASGAATTVRFETVAYDPTARFDITTGTFFSPERGLYSFVGQVDGTLSSDAHWEIWLVTTTATFKRRYDSLLAGAEQSLAISCPAIYLGKGDSAYIQVKGSAGNLTLTSDPAYCFFQGHYVASI